MNSAPYALLFGPFTLQFPQRALYRDGVPIRLGSRAIGLLVALIEAPGELLSQEVLLSCVWSGSVVDEGTLRVNLSVLRKALGDGRGGTQYIKNEAGRGYRFIAPLRRIAVSASAVGYASYRRWMHFGQPGRVLQQRALADAETQPHNLPAAVTRLLGRDQLVERLLDQVGHQRCLTIIGLGGIGKSSVALSIAHRYLASGGVAVGYLDFAPLASPAEIADALVAALVAAAPGASPQHQAEDGDVTAPLFRVIAQLGTRPILLLLDNCEHLIDALTPMVEHLLRAAPSVRLLLTSREPLRAESESIHRLSTLDTPAAGANLTPDQANTYAAVRLFVARATAVRERFILDERNVEAVCEICRRLDGIPLAIEFAAARADWLDAHAIAARLDDRFQLLTKGRRSALPRQQTLRAMLDWSYDLLAPQSQAVLRRVALLPNGFDMAIMLAVAADGGIDPPAVFEAAADLIAKSLINCEMVDGKAHFHLLHTTRHYALERLTESVQAGAHCRADAEEAHAI